MKRYLKRTISLLFSLVLLVSLCSPLAAQAKASDIDHHWAKDVLSWAINNGYINGFEDGSIRPDQPITKAQILTVLCRILNAQDSTSPSSIGLSGSEWYADAAGKALSLGLIRNASGFDAASITRGEAFYLLTRGFQLDQLGLDNSVLAPYPDSRHLQGPVRTSMASLVSSGYVEGYGGNLHPYKNITRAEFAAILYRILPNRASGEALSSAPSGGLVVSGNIQIKDLNFSSPLLLDCTASPVSLENVTAELVILRSQKTGDVSLLGNNQIGRLVLSGGTGEEGQFSLGGGSSVHTLVIGDRSGPLSIDSEISRLEITGSDQSIRLNHSVDELIVGGSRCDIQFGPSVTIGSIQFTDTSSQNNISLTRNIESISLDGQDNRIETSAKVGSLDLYGKRNKLTGTGSVDRATFHTKLSSTDLPCAESFYQLDEVIQNAVLSLDAPQFLPIGETLHVTAYFQNAEERLCEAS